MKCRPHPHFDHCDQAFSAALNRRGQVTIEMILILTLLFGLSVMISDAFKKNNYFATIIEGPWDYVDGMVRNGIWQKVNVSTAAHPNMSVRHATAIGQRGKLNQDPNFDRAETCLAIPPQGC